MEHWFGLSQKGVFVKKNLTVILLLKIAFRKWPPIPSLYFRVYERRALTTFSGSIESLADREQYDHLAVCGFLGVSFKIMKNKKRLLTVFCTSMYAAWLAQCKQIFAEKAVFFGC